MELNMTNVAGNCTNSTTASVNVVSDPTWSFAPTFKLTMFVLVVVLNLFVLAVFCRDKKLRTPFSVYLILLQCCNLIYAIGDYPLAIMGQIYSRWKMGAFACSIHIYALYVFAGITMHTHLLITVNRIWAISFPHSYRIHHNKKVAMLICAGMVSYVHMVCLPGFIMDTLYYRLPIETNGCYLNFESQIIWATTIQFVIYDFPIVFMVAAYPYILYQKVKRNKLRPEGGKFSRSGTRTTDEVQNALATAAEGKG